LSGGEHESWGENPPCALGGSWGLILQTIYIRSTAATKPYEHQVPQDMAMTLGNVLAPPADLQRFHDPTNIVLHCFHIKRFHLVPSTFWMPRGVTTHWKSPSA
jgi:hypothetical protein